MVSKTTISNHETVQRAFGRAHAVVETELPDDLKQAFGVDTPLLLFEAVSSSREARGLRPLPQGDLPTNRFHFRRLLATARSELNFRP